MAEIFAPKKDYIQQLIDQHQPGYSLAQPFYCDNEVYRTDIARVWRQGWLFVGYTCQIPEPGDYFTFEIDQDSLIIIRDNDHQINAFYNTCRHRGTLICKEESGQVNRLVCPYHQWAYGRDGRLLSCRGMHEQMDKSELNLHRAPLCEMEGLIYISLTENQPDFEPAFELMAPLARPQGFDRAKVAKIIDYEINANWKLVWENNRECYHCNANHPQYIKANFDHYNADDTSEILQNEIDAIAVRSEEKWAACNLAITHTKSGMTVFPDHENNIWYSANRTMLANGYVSESMDGKQVAPLMGDYTDPDIGTLRMRTLPNFWSHASCDHVVSTRLAPAGAQRTKARVFWLVQEDAVEDQDYQLNELLPFWQLTSEQDWELCDAAQRGINSSKYTPGLYSMYKEYDVDGFVRWYLKQITNRNIKQ